MCAKDDRGIIVILNLDVARLTSATDGTPQSGIYNGTSRHNVAQFKRTISTEVTVKNGLVLIFVMHSAVVFDGPA